MCARTESGPSIWRFSTPREREVERQVGLDLEQVLARAPEVEVGVEPAVVVVEHALDERRLEVAEPRVGQPREPAEGRRRGGAADLQVELDLAVRRRSCRAAAARRRRARRARGRCTWRSPGALPGTLPADLEQRSSRRATRSVSGLTDGAESARATVTGSLQPVLPHREPREQRVDPEHARRRPAAYHAAGAVEAGRRRPGWCRRSSRASRRSRRTAPPARRSTHCWTRIESAAARAVRRGRRPPSQLSVAGDPRRARCAATRSRRPRASPSACSESRLPASSTRPAARPLSGRASARGIALLPGRREQQRVEPDQAVGREVEAHPPGRAARASPACRRPTRWRPSIPRRRYPPGSRCRARRPGRRRCRGSTRGCGSG